MTNQPGGEDEQSDHNPEQWGSNWLEPEDLEHSRQAHEASDRRGDAYAQEIITSIGEVASGPDQRIDRLKPPGISVERHLEDVKTHLYNLGVSGAGEITAGELRHITPELVRESGFQEDVVFHILRLRRSGIGKPFITPFAVVKKDHFLGLGREAGEGKIDLQKLQDTFTTEAHEFLKPIVSGEQLESALVASDFQRRILRSLYYILSEPLSFTEKFVGRLMREAQEEPLDLAELIGRTINHVAAQFRLVNKPTSVAFSTEENLLILLEEKRIERLQELCRTVLVNGLGILEADKYPEE